MPLVGVGAAFGLVVIMMCAGALASGCGRKGMPVYDMSDELGGSYAKMAAASAANVEVAYAVPVAGAAAAAAIIAPAATRPSSRYDGGAPVAVGARDSRDRGQNVEMQQQRRPPSGIERPRDSYRDTQGSPVPTRAQASPSNGREGHARSRSQGRGPEQRRSPSQGGRDRRQAE
ncbi:hypothetical protein HDU93_006249, partial [Gonapodya sp. JEL0774]